METAAGRLNMNRQILRTLLMTGLLARACVVAALSRFEDDSPARIAPGFSLNNKMFPAGEYSFGRVKLSSVKQESFR